MNNNQNLKTNFEKIFNIILLLIIIINQTIIIELSNLVTEERLNFNLKISRNNNLFSIFS